MNDNQKGNITVLLLTIVAIGLAGTSVFFWQKYESEKATSIRESREIAKPSEVIVDAPVEEVELDLPVVVFTPNGLFTAAERAELNTKFIEPFVDWNTDNDTTTVSINIEKPTPAIAGYAYKVTYIHLGGGNGGFLYGMSTPLEWWLPECMGPVGCNFSDEFEAKYPEIMSQLD